MSDPELRSKQRLIDKFIKENLPDVKNAEDVGEAFSAYWEVEKDKAIKQLATEDLDEEAVIDVVERIEYTSQNHSAKTWLEQ